MIYRQLSNKINFMPSALGFGMMRLPLKDDNSVDVEEAIRIIRYAIDHGVNYIDTAYIYHGGESEKVLASVLKDGYREKVKIADKMPMWQLKEEADLDRIFFDQLDRLQVKKIDFYLLHALHGKSLELIQKLNVISWCEKKKAEGYIDYIGFSFHDEIAVWKQIIDFYDWDFCMLQFNIIDVKVQLDQTAIEYARKKDLGVIIMEPLRGGQLTVSIPTEIKLLWDKMAELYVQNNDTPVGEPYNPVQFILDWLWNFNDIGFMISGMSNFQQVEQNIKYASNSKKNKLTPEQLNLFAKIQEQYLSKIAINCTKCNYCNICPQKIDIPEIFHCLNEVKRYENQKSPTFSYNFIAEERRANKCTACGECVSICPQKLDIPELIKKCSKIFDEKLPYKQIDI